MTTQGMNPDLALADAPSPSLRFLAEATAWIVGLVGLIRLPWVAEHFIGALVTFQTTLVSWYGATASPNILVTSDCSGADVAAVCLGVTLAYPVAWRRRLVGAAVGAAVVFGVNAARIASLYAVASDLRTLNLLHLYVWPALLSLVTVFYVFVWIRVNTRSTAAMSHAWVRFFQIAMGGFVVYAASAPWAFTSPMLARVGAWTAASGAVLLNGLGAQVSSNGAILLTGRGAFQVTQECLFTPMLPLFIAGVCAVPMPKGRRWLWLILTPVVFFALGIARLFALVLPPYVVSQPAVLAHGFYQILAGAALIIAAAHWASRHDGAARASRTSAIALSVAVAVGVVAATTWRSLVEWCVDTISGLLSIAPLPLVAAGDEQGALVLMPAYQLSVLCGLWFALRGGRAWRALGTSLAWLLATQVGFIVGAAAVSAQWGMSPHAILVRAWALAIPAIVALIWTSAGGTRVGDRQYWRFWQDVGEDFPVLTGAASTDYYFENEKRLLSESFPDMTGMLLLKTDLWDEAKNTRIMQWAADQGARIVGVDLSAPIAREAKTAFGDRTLRAVVGDVRRLPLASDSVDGIYSMGTVEHFAETEAAVGEIARVLRPGGRLILGVPNRHDPFLRPLMVAVLHKIGLYGYGFEKSYSRRQLRGMVERAGLTTARETAILFIPGCLRMLDLWCYTRVRPLSQVTGALVRPFVWMDRHLPFVRRHGYLAVNVADKPRAASRRVFVGGQSTGVEYIVDASGCDPNALRSTGILRSLFHDIIGSLGLTAIGEPLWHAFPGEGGVTGITMLSESHLSVHTYPETGYAAFDLYCCRPDADWPWNEKLASALGATMVTIRIVRRTRSS